jgi:hypothetical protein
LRHLHGHSRCGLTAVFDWVPVGVGREESITATKVSA